jgi:sigma-B regulation protein RsbU (phosphoserine phosphatase)
MDAAKAVGGDFYDFYMTDENHLVVTIADVSGKGVPAALYMMRAKTTLKNLVLMANQTDDVASLMMQANQELCRDNESMMFVTVFIAQLDLTTGELVYVNAGHNPPLVRQNGRFRYLVQKKKYTVFGVDEDATYQVNRLVLRPNDMIYLYTDGVTEAMDKNNNLYTEQRLQDALNRIDSNASVQEILAEVRKDVYAHAEGAEQSDDITMLGVRFFGKTNS